MTVEPIAVVPGDSLDEGVWRYREPRSGCVFIVAFPGVMPALWDRYLQGALGVYRRFGVDGALEYEQIRDGRSTSLFFIAVDARDEVVAGVRMQGPYHDIEQVHALVAWAGQPGEAGLRKEVADRMRSGVIEAKGAWVARDVADRSEVSSAISRTPLHAAELLGARYGFAAVASFTVGRHRTSGAVLASDVAAVPYPDDRYQTVPLWWDTQTYRSFADELQEPLIRAEQLMLGISRSRPGASVRRIGRAVEGRHRYGR